MNSVPLPAGYSLSRHADTRIAQRGISRDALVLLLAHGESSHKSGDCETLRLGRATCRSLAKDGTAAELLHAASKLCAVVSSDGLLVTCYYQRRPGRLRASPPPRVPPIANTTH